MNKINNHSIKILQINTVVNWGATGKIAEEIGKAIIKNKWQSFIGYGRYDRESTSKLIKIGTSFDLYTNVLKTRLMDRHGFNAKNATQIFIKEIEKIKPDIIHLHNIHGYYLNIRILFKYLSESKLPIVWTLHDCWSFTGHCAHYTVVDCQKWQTQCFSCPQTSRYPASFFVDNSKKNYVDKKKIFNSLSNLTLVPVSKWLEGELEKSFFENVNVRTINNGIDLNTFRVKNLDIANLNYSIFSNKFVLLGVASVWTKEKGLDDFIELRGFLGKDYHIILVGLNKTQISQIPEGITGIERTEDQDDLVNLYNLADVYVNLTWEDTFPTTNLEAIACGTPVITYNVGGSPEAITLNTGFIIPKGDLHSIIDILKKIKTLGKLYYQESCRNHSLTYYNKVERFEEYLNLYTELLGIR